MKTFGKKWFLDAITNHDRVEVENRKDGRKVVIDQNTPIWLVWCVERKGYWREPGEGYCDSAVDAHRYRYMWSGDRMDNGTRPKLAPEFKGDNFMKPGGGFDILHKLQNPGATETTEAALSQKAYSYSEPPSSVDPGVYDDPSVSADCPSESEGEGKTEAEAPSWNVPMFLTTKEYMKNIRKILSEFDAAEAKVNPETVSKSTDPEEAFPGGFIPKHSIRHQYTGQRDGSAKTTLISNIHGWVTRIRYADGLKREMASGIVFLEDLNAAKQLAFGAALDGTNESVYEAHITVYPGPVNAK